MIQIKKAKRSAARIKIGMSGISGSGKTMSALLLGYGLQKAQHPGMSENEIWEKILVIDTENRSASLYAGYRAGSVTVGEFQTIEIGAPFSAQKYMEAIDAAQSAGAEFQIIDSMSHVWNAEGGLLEMQSNIARRTNNSYTAWRDVTPLFNQLMNKILQCDMHVVMSFRAKKEYAIEEIGGKKKVTPKGMGVTFRDGQDYEATIFFELDEMHTAVATKDRTGLFDQRYFVISPETGREIAAWLDAPRDAGQSANGAGQQDGVTVQMVDQVVKAHCHGMDAAGKRDVARKIREITGGTANYMDVSDPDILRRLYEMFKTPSAAPDKPGENHPEETHEPVKQEDAKETREPVKQENPKEMPEQELKKETHEPENSASEIRQEAPDAPDESPSGQTNDDKEKTTC